MGITGCWNDANRACYPRQSIVCHAKRFECCKPLFVGAGTAQCVDITRIPLLKVSSHAFAVWLKVSTITNDVHPIPDDFRNYVGLTDAITEKEVVNPAPFPPKEEKPIQMKDGGDKGNEMSSGLSENKKPARTASTKYPDDFEAFWTNWKAKGGGGDKSPAHGAWKKLSAPDREFATSIAV